MNLTIESYFILDNATAVEINDSECTTERKMNVDHYLASEFTSPYESIAAQICLRIKIALHNAQC